MNKDQLRISIKNAINMNVSEDIKIDKALLFFSTLLMHFKEQYPITSGCYIENNNPEYFKLGYRFYIKELMVSAFKEIDYSGQEVYKNATEYLMLRVLIIQLFGTDESIVFVSSIEEYKDYINWLDLRLSMIVNLMTLYTTYSKYSDYGYSTVSTIIK